MDQMLSLGFDVSIHLLFLGAAFTYFIHSKVHIFFLHFHMTEINEQLTTLSCISSFLVVHTIMVCFAIDGILQHIGSGVFAGRLCKGAILAAQSLLSRAPSNPHGTRAPFLTVAANGLGSLAHVALAIPTPRKQGWPKGLVDAAPLKSHDLGVIKGWFPRGITS